MMEEGIEGVPPEEKKVSELTPQSKRVNILVKVLNVGEPREIPSRFGEPRKIAEANVGDETGTVVLSLWQDQIGTVQENDVLYIENGYVSLFRGHIRLNVGKYGKLTKSDKEIPNVNSENNISDAEHEQPRREFRPRRGGFRSGGGGGGFRSGGGYRRRY